MKDAKLLRAFEEFESLRRETADGGLRGKILSLAAYTLPTFFPLSSLVFGRMAGDFTRGLIGEVNRFLVNVHHADCWVRVAAHYEEAEKLGLQWEFADPLLELSVSRPYSVRNQFIFAVVHLAHQANSRKKKDRQDKLPPDKHINFDELAKVGVNWKSWPQFMKNLEELNDKAFQDEHTRNFRNLLQHRIRLHFDTGLTTFFERSEEDGRVTYAYKAFPPLQLDALIRELYKQHEKCVEAFKAYWQLVNEFCAAMGASNS